MQIKKSTLKFLVISLALFALACSIGLPIYYKQKREQQQSEEIRLYVNKLIEREYKSLLWDYEYYVKEALDYSNSYSLRTMYVRKINKLFGYAFYSFDPVLDFKREYDEKNETAKSILREMAIERAKESLSK